MALRTLVDVFRTSPKLLSTNVNLQTRPGLADCRVRDAQTASEVNDASSAELSDTASASYEFHKRQMVSNTSEQQLAAELEGFK